MPDDTAADQAASPTAPSEQVTGEQLASEQVAGKPALRTTDPAVMRALAHPLRIDILDLVDDLKEATASEIAARTGQTVANCSFHLRVLASAGLIERAEPRGREKPWRSAHGRRDFRPAPEDPASVDQSTTLASIYVEREAARILDFLADAPGALQNGPEAEQWLDSITITTSRFWATAEEMAQLALDIQQLTDRFTGRRDDPSKRPEGARPGHLFAVANPELRPSGAHEGADSATDDD